MTVDRNVHWDVAAAPATQLFPPTQAPTMWAQWRAHGQGRRLSVVPAFVVAPAFDISTLAPTSPALALGFVLINTTCVGPRPGGYAPWGQGALGLGARQGGM
jgi:hypothetical protein